MKPILVSSLKSFYRGLFRDTVYSLINIAGLSIGIACCIILGLYLQNELTYDRHFAENKRLYRVASELNANGSVNTFAQTAYALGPFLAANNPDIAAFVRFSSYQTGYSLFQYQDESYSWDSVFLADENIFEVFNHDIIYGDPLTALGEPKSIAVSRDFAQKYFGQENPIGKVLRGELSDYRVTLVFDNLPKNTHLKYDALITYKEQPPSIMTPTLTERVKHDLWYAKTDYTYLLMPAAYSVAEFRKVSDAFFQKYMSSYKESFNSSMNFFLEPLNQIHLSSTTQRDRPRGSKFYVLAFSAVAIFVLGIACINYMNLSTARFTKRTKEVAIRRILGAQRRHLILQFLFESVAFSALALVFALLITKFSLEFTSLNTLFETSIALTPLARPEVILMLVAGTFALGLLSGMYPALLLSKGNSTNTLRKNNPKIRQTLVFIQFLISVCAISCTLLMYLQMSYIQGKSMGFDKENKITMVVEGAESIEKIPAFAGELKKNSSVLDVSISRSRVGSQMGFGQAEIENNNGVFETQSYNWFYIDDHYIDTMEIDIVAGRNFDPDTRDDINKSVLVNETLVKKMGWQDPIGKRINYEQGETVRVVGVMKDFHFQGLQHEIEPILFWLSPPPNYQGWNKRRKALQNRILTINVAGEGVFDTLSDIRAQWDAFDFEHPFEFHFLEDLLNRLYSSDLRQMKLLGLFAGLCVFISCLGLFGLTAFTIEQRTKEIGVRKVLGASSLQIIMLLFNNVLYIVLLAAVAASCVAYWVMSQWLQSFHYHTSINPLVFLTATLLSVLVAFLTIAIQSYQTARSNPVLALRYE
ncbi:FtsX-like permease family protein [Exilibacterium tricleocarpae]|uniref:FtsX-like permease family protein n=1 Tax=Exilibacterium tricleocarpae TaxID=2591008 RepID=A0A545TFN9_9GAMM|nr:ABC transporter permease [Exilibacterium tricleocarpae]TQV76047.1 FtsX-like permease family protein [Exilibacterium tricleocarpae]